MNFAFPNVNPHFIGCGRYSALEHRAADYTELTLFTEDQDLVEHAAAVLAPPPQHVSQTVYETQDQPDQTYAGDSLHLAYLLSYINCYRLVKPQYTEDDIWCTGRINLEAGQSPRLYQVGGNGFTKKLEAFLCPDNHNPLFIVPAKNIKFIHEVLCRKYHATLMTLEEFQAESDLNTSHEKYVVMVLPDELYRLMSVVFQLGPNPYKGLASFEQQDAAWFFGREDVTQRICQWYNTCGDTIAQASSEPRFLAVLGPSGAGKSSVVKAGFLTHVEHKNSDGRPPPIVAFCKPGDQPLSTLTAEILRQIPEASLTDDSLTGLETELRQNPDRVVQMTATLTKQPLLLVIDQFEEIYVSKEKNRDAGEKDDVGTFIANLLAAASASTGGLLVIIVLRSDFLNYTKRHPALDNAIARNNIIIPAIPKTQLRRVIEEPAKRAGAPLDTGIIDLLIDETREDEGTLPLLEFALTRIWEGLEQGVPPKETLENIHGVGGALADRAEQVYTGLDAYEQRIARRAFLKLVAIGDQLQDYVGRRVNVADLVAHQEDFTTVFRVLDKFAQTEARLITLTANNAGQQMAQITHDALIRYWKRLAEWLEVWHEDRRFDERFANAAKYWQQNMRSRHLLWRGLELKKLRTYHQQHREDMTERQLQFFRAAQFWHYQIGAAKWGSIILLIFLTVFSGAAWFRTQIALNHLEQQRNDIIRNLTLSADQLMKLDNELDALASIVKAFKDTRTSQEYYARFSHWRLPTWGELESLLKPEPSSQAEEQELRAVVEETFKSIGLSVVEMNRLQHHNGNVSALSFSADGSLLASGSSDGTIRIWHREDGRQIRILEIERWAKTLGLAFHPQRAALVSGHLDNLIRIWDVQTGSIIRTLRGHQGAVRNVAYAPDGMRVVSASQDHTIKLWNAETGREIRTLRGHDGTVYSVAVHPKGKIAASAGHDGAIYIWDLATGQKLQTLRGHEGIVYSVAFSPDGNLLASGGQDQKLHLWNLNRETPIDTFAGHTDRIFHVTFHPDGQTIASACRDHTITLWNITGRQKHINLSGHADEVLQVAFSPDGTILASSGRDQMIRFWMWLPLPSTTPLDDLLTLSCQRIQGYLHTNPTIRDEDRSLCEDIIAQ